MTDEVQNQVANSDGIPVSLLSEYLQLKTKLSGCVLLIFAVLQTFAALAAYSISYRADKVERLLKPSYLHTVSMLCDALMHNSNININIITKHYFYYRPGRWKD